MIDFKRNDRVSGNKFVINTPVRCLPYTCAVKLRQPYKFALSYNLLSKKGLSEKFNITASQGKWIRGGDNSMTRTAGAYLLVHL